MKITDVQSYVVDPDIADYDFGHNPWAFVVIETDEGISGWGECSNSPGGGSFLVAQTVRILRDSLVGEDPADIERIWHKIYRRFTFLGSRGLPTSAISGIDIALWDIKGKALGRPVYDLLGGRFRSEIPLYANVWFLGCETPDAFAEAAKRTVAAGHTSLKLDPFRVMRRFHTGYVDGHIPADGEQLGYDIVAAIREAVGPKVEILIDAHGMYNVPTAIRLGNRLFEQSKIGWWEEPVPPESYGALRSIRENCDAPMCTGERFFTRFDFVPVFEQKLADYVMPDVVWTGGISELKRIATMAEAYYIPISPHDAMGPGQIIAGAHVCATIPNLYRLEHSVASIPGYNSFLTEPLGFDGGVIRLNEKPGLGVDLDMDYVKGHLHKDWSV